MRNALRTDAGRQVPVRAEQTEESGTEKVVS